MLDNQEVSKYFWGSLYKYTVESSDPSVKRGKAKELITVLPDEKNNTGGYKHMF